MEIQSSDEILSLSEIGILLQLKGLPVDLSNIRAFCDFLKVFLKHGKLFVLTTVVGQDWDSVSELVNVRIWRIVNQDCVPEVPINNTEVFGVNVVVNLDTVLSVETMSNHLLCVDHIQNYVRVRTLRGSESDNFIMAGKSLEESYCVGSNRNVSIGVLTFPDFNWNRNVILADFMFLTVQDRLVNIDNECFLSHIGLITSQSNLFALNLLKCWLLNFVQTPENFQRNL